MSHGNTRVSWIRPLVALMVTVVMAASGFAQGAAPSPSAKAVGEIKSISGGTLTLATDDGNSIAFPWRSKYA